MNTRHILEIGCYHWVSLTGTLEIKKAQIAFCGADEYGLAFWITGSDRVYRSNELRPLKAIESYEP